MELYFKSPKQLIMTILINKVKSIFSEKNATRQLVITVASRQAKNNALQIKMNRAATWEEFTGDIAGFDYVEGFEYEIMVSKHKSANQFSLERVLTQTRKNSDFNS